MSFKLLFKQSWHDFLKKILLYLTFMMFLILVISVSLGMISFSAGFKSSFDQTIGKHRINAEININRFLPAWVEEDEVGTNNYWAKEEKENEHGYLYNFLGEILENEKDENGNALDLSEEDLNLLTLGIGFLAGEAEELISKYFLENKILEKYFDTQEKIVRYNQNILYVRKALNENYQTINLGRGYFLRAIKKNSDWTTGGFHTWEYDIEVTGLESQRLYWDFLRTNPKMGQIHDDTPWTMQANQTLIQKNWKEVDLNQVQYREYRDQQRIVYVQPIFLQRFNYQLGDVLELRFTTWDQQEYRAPPIKLLIGGVATTAETMALSDGIVLLLPYQQVNKIADETNQANGQTQIQQIGNRPVPYGRNIVFNIGMANRNLVQGQRIASEFLTTIFKNLRNPNEPLESSTNWAQSYGAYAFDFTITLFLLIAYIIGFVSLILLFVVFYFIAQQIVVLQRNTLFFLKSMGVSNQGLSLLTTFALMPPILIGILTGFFGALAIQNMMYGIAFEQLTFYEPFFSFNLAYFLTLIFIIVGSALIFYFINNLLIKSKTLTIEGMTSLKANAKSFEKVKMLIIKAPTKFRIGFAFAFKNIYKNLICFLILSITFGIILFSTQFNQSLSASASAFEKWNQPYKSANYAQELSLFAPTENENDEYIREYETISSLQDLHPIKSVEDVNEVIDKYQDSLTSEKQQVLEFNWKDYYLEEQFVKESLDWILKSPENYQTLIQMIEERFDGSVALEIINLIDQLIAKYQEAQNDYGYQGGFTILMGQVFAPEKKRAIFSAQSWSFQSNWVSQTLAFAKGDWVTKNHFGFQNLNDEDFVISGEQRNNEFQESKKLLRINISDFLRSIENLHHGDVIEIEIRGLKSAFNARTTVIHAYVDQIIKSDTINPAIYTSQVGMIQCLLDSIPESSDPDLNHQKEVYEALLQELKTETTTLNNTVFDEENILPLGLRYLTIPIFHHTDSSKPIGSRIEDFYDDSEFVDYWNELGQKAMIFSEVTKHLLVKAAPFTDTLQKFVWILLIVSIVVSAILIALILLENKEVILLFKAMGYKKSEVNWYLISGYFVSAILATITGVGFALGTLILASEPIAEFLTTTVAFVWSWQFIVFALGLGAMFCLAIAISIVVYTNLQKPKEAFMAL